MDDQKHDLPRHLMITGINGTGKTVLLESIHQELRKKYSDLTGDSISYHPNKEVRTKLTYCENFGEGGQKYFEPLFITTDDMLMLTKREKCSDYVNLFFTIAKASKAWMFDLKNAVSKLYRDEFEDLDLKTDQIRIKLKNRAPFGVSHMSSGHYFFLNVYCYIRFSQSAFQWENKDFWASMQDELRECRKLSETVAVKLSNYKSNYSEEQPGDLGEIIKSENDYAEKLEMCANRLFGEKLDKKDFPFIILIDEPESHLHIALQRTILPYLAECFKNAQFIVATHSPFVVTSLSNATLFNMENRERLIVDLTLYSYQNVIEEWFDLNLYSDETIALFKKFKELAEQDSKLTDSEKDNYQKLYKRLIQTDLCSAVTRLNLRKEIKDGEIYVLR